MLERITSALIRSLSPLASTVKEDRLKEQQSNSKKKKEEKSQEQKKQALFQKATEDQADGKKPARPQLQLVPSQPDSEESPDPSGENIRELNGAEGESSSSQNSHTQQEWTSLLSAFQGQKAALLQAFGRKAYQLLATQKSKGKVLHKGVILDQRVE